MEKLKGFLVSHFEKVSVLAALILAVGLFFFAYQGERTKELRDDLEELKTRIVTIRRQATVEPEYDPESLKGGGKEVLVSFRKEHTGLPMAAKAFLPPRMILRELVLKVPAKKRYEEEHDGLKGKKIKLISGGDDEIILAEKVDDAHFKLIRTAGMDRQGTTRKDIRYEDDSLEAVYVTVTSTQVYEPKPPIDVEVTALPGRNVIVWHAHPDDLEHVEGFNVFRKESETAGFDAAKPLNAEPIRPATSWPTEPDEPEEDVVEEAVEKDKAGEGVDEGADDTGGAEPEPFDLLKKKTEGPGERGFTLTANCGSYIDRSITPLKKYWYAVQTVARKPAVVDEAPAAVPEPGGREPEPAGEVVYLYSGLSEVKDVLSEDVIRIVFRSKFGDLDDKKDLRVGIEVQRYVGEGWVDHPFTVKIGDRIGGPARANVMRRDVGGGVNVKRETVDFTTKYTLVDVVLITVKQKYIDIKYVPGAGGTLVPIEEVKYRDIRSYKITVKHDDREEIEEFNMERLEKKDTGRTTPSPERRGR